MIEKQYQNEMKVYVTVQARFFPDGRYPIPECIWWEDGRRYEVDRVGDIRRAASTKAGGIGIRYMCRIGARQVPLWYEDENQRWFMERRSKE